MIDRIPVRTLDASRYAQTFAVFVARSFEYPAMTDRLVGVAADLPDGFACLDIGAGTGKVIGDWLAAGGRRPGRYVAIEPNPDHVTALRETVAACDIEADVIVEPFHHGFAIEGEYDLALFSHSVYWLGDPAACVRRAYDALRPGGWVVVFVQGPFGVHPMARLYEPLFERDRPRGPNHELSSHELVRDLRAAGLDPRVDFDPTPLDLTGLFDAGAERERDEFISFCLQIEFAELAEPIKSDVIAYLRAACVEEAQRLLWYEPNATVWLRR